MWILKVKNFPRDDAGRVLSHVFVCDVPAFDPFPCPGGSAEKGKAGFHAGIVKETTNRDPASHLCPAIPLDQLFDNGFQRDSVQGIAGMGKTHERMVSSIWVMTDKPF